MKTVLITGASSGIGKAAALRFLREGYRVFGAARRTERMADLAEKGIIPLRLDVTDADSCKEGVAAAVSRAGGIDVLVNCAGYGEYGPIETVPIAGAGRQMDVNVYGAVRVIQAALPHMQRGGTIINISSAGGRAGTYLGGWYHAAKYALEAVSDALRRELSDEGISVVLIEPGGVASAWGGITAEHLQNAGRHTRYQQDCDKLAAVYRGVYRDGSKALTSCDTVARKIVTAAGKRRPRARYLFGFGAKPLVAMNALLPDKVYDRLIRKILISRAAQRFAAKQSEKTEGLS